MKTLKLTMAVTALVLSSIICQAQEKGMQKKKQDKIAQQLNLNPEQTKKMKVLNETHKAKNKVIQAKITPVKEQLRALQAEKKAISESKMKEIESILTPEQFMKFKEIKANRKGPRKDRKGKR